MSKIKPSANSKSAVAARKPYITPRIAEEAEFEALSLACASKTANQTPALLCDSLGVS